MLEILSLFYDFSYFLVSSLLIPFEVVFEEAIDILADINKMNEKQLIILGVDGVGKTTLLYRLILGEIVTTIPTIGFNVETLKYKGYYWNLWDIGGSEKLIHLWIHYMSDKKGIIYIIDSSNIKRREEYVKVFINMVQTIRSIKKENENKKKILILFNIFEEKQDKIDNNEFLDEVKEKSRFTGKIFTLELSILKENLTSLKNLLSNFFI